MAMRRAFVLAGLLLAACSIKSGEGEQGSASGAGGEASPSASPATLSCALNGSTSFKDECTLERTSAGGKATLVLRHPDGGFRRLEELEAGKRFKVLDGADEAVVVANGADFELTVGDDHYLFPGPVAGPDASNAAKN